MCFLGGTIHTYLNSLSKENSAVYADKCIFFFLVVLLGSNSDYQTPPKTRQTSRRMSCCLEANSPPRWNTLNKLTSLSQKKQAFSIYRIKIYKNNPVVF
jgi:hypothetical protein